MRVNTDPSIQAHCHPSHTVTAERSLRVDAVAIHTHARSLTLINVYTHAPTVVKQESRFTDAFEAAIFIDTQSIEAHVPDQTLVLVFTVFAICSNFKSSIADTVEAALSVDTAAIVADTTIGHTLIQISALCPGCCRLESSRTLTEVRPRRVHTFSVCTWVSVTFIIINALSPYIQPEPHVALTAISNARHWDAPAIQAQVAVGLAHIGDILSLDNRRTWRGRLYR